MSQLTNEIPNELEAAVRVLSLFANSARLNFDRILATRTLGGATRAIPGSSEQIWSRRLVEVGESLGLRVRILECTLEEALHLTSENMPICTCIQDAKEQLRWYAIGATRNRRVQLISMDKSPDRWVSIRKLRRLLNLPQEQDTCAWIVGQAALPYEPENVSHASHASHSASDKPHAHGGGDGHHHHGHGITPFRRLIRILRPERSDLVNVLIFSTVVALLALATPIAVEALVNTVAFGQMTQPVIILSLILLIFLGFAAAFEGLNVMIVEIVQRRIFTRVVEDLAYRIPRVDQRALDGHYGPELVNRFFDVVTVQKVATKLVLDGAGVILQMVIGMLVLAFYHPFLLGFDVILLALILFAFFGLGQGAVTTSINTSRAKYEIAAWLQELAHHSTAFKLHSGSQFALDRADQLAINYLDARKRHFQIYMRQVLFMLTLQAVSATALLGLGGWLVLRQELTLGQLVAAELIVAIIVGSVSKLVRYVASFYDVLASVDKLGHLFDLPIESHDKLFHLSEAKPASVRLHRVEYFFGQHCAIHQFSAGIAPGEVVAIVGPPGCGKSTLFDLLCAVRIPDNGHIEFDGIDTRELRPDSLREHIALARGIEIFPGTIDENVHLNRPNITAGDVRDALTTVGLLDWVTGLPDGLNTQLQTGGMPLSSTQGQLLMLARAIVSRPRLLLIDGTLDTLTDHLLERIFPDICSQSAPWTTIIATNRGDIANRCQRVLSLASSMLTHH